MSNQNKTEINRRSLIVAIFWFLNIYWAFTEYTEPVFGVICFGLGLVFIIDAFSNKSD